MSDSSDRKEKDEKKLKDSDKTVGQSEVVPMDVDSEHKISEAVATSMQIEQEEASKVTEPDKSTETPEDVEMLSRFAQRSTVAASSSHDASRSITSAGRGRKSSLTEGRLRLAVNILEDLASKQRAAFGITSEGQKTYITIPKIKIEGVDFDPDEMNVDSDVPEELSAPEGVAGSTESHARLEDPTGIPTGTLTGPEVPAEKTEKEKPEQPEISVKDQEDKDSPGAQAPSYGGARPKVLPLKKNRKDKRKGRSKRRGPAADEGMGHEPHPIGEEALKTRREEWTDVTIDPPKPPPPAEGSEIHILRERSATMMVLEFRRRREYSREDSSAWQTAPLPDYHEPRRGFILDREPPELVFNDDFQVPRSQEAGIESNTEPAQGTDADEPDPHPGPGTQKPDADNPDPKPGSSTEESGPRPGCSRDEPGPSSGAHGGRSSEGRSSRGFFARVFRPLMSRQREATGERRFRSSSSRPGAGSHKHAADEQPIPDEAAAPVEEELPGYMLMPFDMRVPEPIRRDLEPHRLLAAIDRFAQVLRNPIGAWRTLMRVAYGTGRYHSRVTLMYARESLRMVGVSEEEFHTLFHQVYMQLRQPDEGIGEDTTELEEKIRDCIFVNGEVTFAMLYADIEHRMEQERMQAMVIRQREERRRAAESQALEEQRLQQAPSNDSDNDSSSVSDVKTNTNTDRVQYDEPEKPSKLPYGVLKGYVNLKLDDSSSANIPDTPPKTEKPPKVSSFDKSSEESRVSSPVGIASPDPEGSDNEEAPGGSKSDSKSPVDVLFPKEKLLKEQKFRREQGKKSYSSSGEECNMCDDSTMGSVSPIPHDLEMPEEMAIPEEEQITVVNHVLVADMLDILSSRESSDEQGDDEEFGKEAAGASGIFKDLQEEGADDSEMEHLLTSSVTGDCKIRQVAEASKPGADSSESSQSEGVQEKDQVKRKDRLDQDDSSEKDSKRRHL